MIKLNPIGNNSWIISNDDEIRGLVSKKVNGEYTLLNDNQKNDFISFEHLENYLSIDNSKLKVDKNKYVTEKRSSVFIKGYPVSYSSPILVENTKYNNLPLFTKIEGSDILYCAGHYCMKFSKSWMYAFCPKLATIRKYEYLGPFYTKEETKDVMEQMKQSYKK